MRHFLIYESYQKCPVRDKIGKNRRKLICWMPTGNHTIKNHYLQLHFHKTITFANTEIHFSVIFLHQIIIINANLSKLVLKCRVYLNIFFEYLTIFFPEIYWWKKMKNHPQFFFDPKMTKSDIQRLVNFMMFFKQR